MKRTVALVALLLLASACNSTNRLHLAKGGEITSGQPGASGGSGPGATVSGTGKTGAAAKNDSAAAGGSTGSAGTSGAGGGTVASSSGTAPAVVAKHAAIKVGFIVIKGGDALVTNSLGTPVSFGDGNKQVGALVRDLNKRGGINGRLIDPHIYQWNVADPNDSPANGCVKLTEDDHVFAILTVVNLDQNMIACAAKHKTILVNASFGAGDAYYYKVYGDWFFSPSLLNLNIQKKLLVSSLASKGILKVPTKVGVAILGTDQQYQRVSDGVIVPALKAAHVPYDTYSMSSDADVSGAVLRFQADGVNLVIFSSSSAIPPLLFMRDADSQGFAPRYGMTDSDDTTTLGQYGPRSQTQKIVGVGALPISNVAPNQYPISSTEGRCLALMRAAGENDVNRRSNLTAEPYCEAVWEFEAVTKRLSGTLTGDAWRTVFPSVKTSYSPVTAFAVDFANGRHDNASLYRELAWKTSCTCVSYTSGPRPVPRS